MYPPMYALDHKHTAVITIGRNIENEPMGDTRWDSFVGEVNEIVKNRSLQVYTARAYGEGRWENPTGGGVIIESSCSWVFEMEEASAKYFKNALHELAKKYEQDGIALILGSTTIC